MFWLVTSKFWHSDSVIPMLWQGPTSGPLDAAVDWALFREKPVDTITRTQWTYFCTVLAAMPLDITLPSLFSVYPTVLGQESVSVQDWVSVIFYKCSKFIISNHLRWPCFPLKCPYFILGMFLLFFWHELFSFLNTLCWSYYLSGKWDLALLLNGDDDRFASVVT